MAVKPDACARRRTRVSSMWIAEGRSLAVGQRAEIACAMAGKTSLY